MTEFEQNVLLAISALTIGTTLVVILWQWVRSRRRGDD